MSQNVDGADPAFVASQSSREGVSTEGFNRGEAVRHAKTDIEYVNGLEAHLDEGGLHSDRNTRDLISMVRWNAECMIAIAMEAEGRDGEARLDAKHDSAGIAQPPSPTNGGSQ